MSPEVSRACTLDTTSDDILPQLCSEGTVKLNVSVSKVGVQSPYMGTDNTRTRIPTFPSLMFSAALTTSFTLTGDTKAMLTSSIEKLTFLFQTFSLLSCLYLMYSTFEAEPKKPYERKNYKASSLIERIVIYVIIFTVQF